MTFRSVLLLVCGWIATAVLCWIGLPTADPHLAPQDASLQVLGMVGIVVMSCAVSLHLHDRMAWLTRPASRRLSTVRLAWLAWLIVLDLLLSIGVSPMLPAGLGISMAYASTVWMWLGIAVACGATLSPLLALIVPFVGFLIATSGALPFPLNPVQNPQLDLARLVIGGLGVLLAASLYGIRGAPADAL